MLKTCVPFDEFEVAMGNALEAGPPELGACMGAEGPMIRLLLYMAGTCECDTKRGEKLTVTRADKDNIKRQQKVGGFSKRIIYKQRFIVDFGYLPSPSVVTVMFPNYRILAIIRRS